MSKKGEIIKVNFSTGRKQSFDDGIDDPVELLSESEIRGLLDGSIKPTISKSMAKHFTPEELEKLGFDIED